MSRSIWATLGIKATNDATEIRRAYAKRLKTVHPEDDPEGFQALRAAYDRASDMARNGWAVPQTRHPHEVLEGEPDVDADADTAGRDDPGGDRWNAAAFAVDDLRGRDAPSGDRWARSNEPVPPVPAVADAPGWDARAEQARAVEQGQAHQALCDQLSRIVRGPTGDGQEALSVLIRIFRSPAMDSLQTHSRTERWLAQLVGFGGPAAEDLVEPVIQFFGWNTSRIGVDLSHAQPVLRRRDAADMIRRLEWSDSKEYAAWQTLKRKPNLFRRIRDRLTPGLSIRVSALLQRIAFDLPDLEARMNPESAALWRARLAQPILGPVFLLTVLLGAPIAAQFWNQARDFGPPDGMTFLALCAVIAFGLFSLGVAYLHGVARPRQAWVSSDPWSRPLWLRLGWAPAALFIPLLGGVLPPAWWVAPLLLLTGLGLWGWARVTSAHVPRTAGVRVDWGRLAGIAPIFGFLLLQAELVSPYGIGLTLGLVTAALVLQTGADAFADELAHQPLYGRTIAAGQMTFVGLGLAAVLAGAATGVGLPQVTGLVLAIALGDRALAWNRAGSLLTARRFVLLFGWIGGFVIAAMLPYDSFPTQAFVALGLWLLSAAALNALHGLVDGLNLFPWSGTRGRNRKHGSDDHA